MHYTKLPDPFKAPEKNERWKDFTPNEAYIQNPLYAEFIKTYASLHGIPGPLKFNERRIIARQSHISFYDSQRWWDNSRWMDKIVWTFMKPVYLTVGGARLEIPFLVLEPYETLRVISSGVVPGSVNPFVNPEYGILIPLDCTSLCFFDMKAGYSEHKRDRPEPTTSPEDEDKQAILEIEADKVMEKVLDLQASFPEHVEALH